MKHLLLFVFEDHKPNGGVDDLWGDYDDMPQIMEELKNVPIGRTCQVLNMQTGITQIWSNCPTQNNVPWHVDKEFCHRMFGTPLQ